MYWASDFKFRKWHSNAAWYTMTDGVRLYKLVSNWRVVIRYRYQSGKTTVCWLASCYDNLLPWTTWVPGSLRETFSFLFGTPLLFIGSFSPPLQGKTHSFEVGLSAHPKPLEGLLIKPWHQVDQWSEIRAQGPPNFSDFHNKQYPPAPKFWPCWTRRPWAGSHSLIVVDLTRIPLGAWIPK